MRSYTPTLAAPSLASASRSHVRRQTAVGVFPVAVSISAVVLLAVIVFLLIRKGGLKVGHAIVCVLLGFYLASSSIAPTISEATRSLARMIGGIRF